MSIKISVLTVSLNSGDRLRKTLESISTQTYKDFEVIIKDGGSTDGSINCIKDFASLPIVLETSKDTGIYDAMNQAAQIATGEYVYFLNCGDCFYDETVLYKIAGEIEALCEKEDKSYIVYGNIFDRVSNQVVPSNPKIDGFACYRNVPCHQACFYKRELVLMHPFNTQYRIRADYEQFLWCFYEAKAGIYYKDTVVADYEGGGFSETKENISLSKKEHKDITGRYMEPAELFKYKTIMFLSMAGLRTKLARNKKTAAIYNKIKKMIYK